MVFILRSLQTYLSWWVLLFTQPLRSGRIWHKVNFFFKRSLTSLNSEFSFFYTSCITKAEKPSLPYYLRIARGRIIGFIPFPRVLVLCEIQSGSSRIWTCVTVSISYDDSHYTTGTSDWYWKFSFDARRIMGYLISFYLIYFFGSLF